MTTKPQIDDALRRAIISRPDTILDDKDVMHALIAANEKTMGDNIIDLRGIAMDRLETRLDRLEDTHRSVIAAAYENLAGTNQVHRAVLRLLEADEFEGFLRDLNGPVSEILKVDAIRLVLEATQAKTEDPLASLENVLCIQPKGFVDAYIAAGRQVNTRIVTLRHVQEGDPALYGQAGAGIRSEACLQLNLGSGRLPGLLLLGAQDPAMLAPQQGTDLLLFFAGVFERTLRRWLS